MVMYRHGRSTSAFFCGESVRTDGEQSPAPAHQSPEADSETCKVCLQVLQSPSAVCLLAVSHIHAHPLIHKHTHALDCKPSFPKAAKVSEGILFGWDHGGADGVAQAHSHSWHPHPCHATHHHRGGHAHIHAHVHSHHPLVHRNSTLQAGGHRGWHAHAKGSRHAHRHGAAGHDGIGWRSDGSHMRW